MVYLIIIVLISIILVVRYINFLNIVSILKNNNGAVGGLRGKGKDVLCSNAIARYKGVNSYICNVDYKIKGKNYIPLELSNLDIKNNFENFINGNFNKYIYPYEDNIPIYISDAQNYLPSAYETELKKKYQGLVNYMPLSRHLGNNNIVVNSQNFKLVWDKLRVQCDKYILCMRCKFLFRKFIFMKVRIYEKYESFISRIPPYRAPIKLLGNKKVDISLHKISYIASYGVIKSMNLFFINKSNYDSRFMKGLLENGN